jgi:hypothetical protein
MRTYSVPALLAYVALAFGTPAYATSYYINNLTGSDSNSGTSSGAPWSTFNNVNSHTFVAGDNINLACGCIWNQEMDLVGAGTSSNWITVTSYGSGSRPAILRGKIATNRCIRLTNSDYWSFNNLEVGDAGEGILVNYTTISHQGLYFSNIYAHDCNGIFDGTNGGSADNIVLSAGIGIVGKITLTASQYAIKGITFVNIEGTHNQDSVQIYPWAPTMSDGSDGHTVVQNVFATNLYLHDDDADGLTGSCADSLRFLYSEDILVMNSTLNNEADGYIASGTAATFIEWVQNLQFVNCVVTNTPSTGSPDETGWDNEGFTNNITFNGDYFSGNAGAGIEFLAIHGSTAFDSNNTVSGNLFVENGSTGTGHSIGSMSLVGSNVTQTGTVQNNLFSEFCGFATSEGTDPWSGFSFSNNLGADEPANTYNAGDGFSSVQGFDQWSYQYYNGSSWNNMTVYNSSTPVLWGSWGANSNTALIFQQAEQPDATNADWVARTWTAPLTGNISIRGWALKQTVGGSGMMLEITQNGTSIWGGTGTFLGANDQTGFATNADVAVTVGDVVRFQASNGGSGNNTDDIVSWAPNIAYTSSVPIPNTVPPALSNPSFESPVTATYVYGPFTYGWVFAGESGVDANGSAFGAPTAPEGVQTVFLQGNTGTISQSVTFPAGTYVVSFLAAQRSGTGGAQAIKVYCDSTQIGSWTTIPSAFTQLTTASFAVTAGSHTIEFAGQNSGNNTAFVDAVSISNAAPQFSNPGFETPVTSSYEYGPITSGWTINSEAGVQKNGSAWGAPTAPEGVQTAFLQGSLATISQAVTFPAGTYTVSFRAALRSGSTQGIAAYCDSNVIGLWTTVPGSFTQFTTGNFTVETGSHIIEFKPLNSGDNSVFIDAAWINNAAPQVLDSSFETPVTASYEYGPFSGAWAITSSAGVQMNGSPWGAPAAPVGAQTAFLQGSAATISQSLTFPAGTYEVTFMAAQRTGAGGAQAVKVYCDSTQIGSWTTIPSAFTQMTTGSFTVAAGSHSISFDGQNSGDNTAFIDAVSIVRQ